MALYAKGIDSVFQTAGTKPEIEIWCVEKLQLVSLPKSLLGKFYSGNAYVVLNTIVNRNGISLHDIHYWIGKDATEEESTLASDKALELDQALGSCTVQYREVQGQETEKFLAYFKPCMIPIEGVFSSEPGRRGGEGYKVTLLSCKGEHVVSVKEVPFARSSLTHNDVFILDTASKIFLFSGCNSSIQERAKALEVVHYVNENKHGGNCEVATIEDGKLVGDPDVGEFWSLFGGYAPIPKDSTSVVQQQCDTTSSQLFWITTQGKLHRIESSSLTKQLLESNKCYMVDCGAEIFVWMGKTTLMTERKTSISAIEDFVRNQGRSTAAHLSFLTEESESSIFRSYFTDWPQVVEQKLYEEGREKVAAMFKQNGYEVKELPVEEDHIPHISCQGKLKVWRVDGKELILLSVPEQKKLFNGDCYIIQYTYENNQRDENILYVWIGRESQTEDRVDAVSSAEAIVDSAKGAPVVAQIIQDKEPELFFLIFQTVIVFKGGLSTRYKSFLADLGVSDETYDGSKTSLFRVQGPSTRNMQAVQVDLVSASLNSSYCYILQAGTSIYTWIGNLASSTDHDLLDRMLELINPTWQPISVREGSEPDDFWNALGGKADYPKGKTISRHTEDPHLFKVTNNGHFKVKEVYNFTQDDLTTEDVFVLNCHEEIFVWIGRHSDVKSKQQGLSFGLNFLESDPLVEGLSLETPIYVVAEGHEPPLFTRFFEWDAAKANMHGNSFERKLALLKGKQQNLEAPPRNSRVSLSREATPDRRKSVSSNGKGNALPSAASNGSGSHISSPNNLKFSSSPPVTRKLFPESPNGSAIAVGSSPSTRKVVDHPQANGSNVSPNSLVYPYERLKVNSSDLAPGIDITKRETYLSDEEFQEKLGMGRKSFYGLARWKQNKLKMSVQLF
ncbi:VLN1 [Linum grandiflorum]